MRGSPRRGRARRAKNSKGVRAYAATVGDAIGQALTLAGGGAAAGRASGRRAALGDRASAPNRASPAPFNRRVLDAAERAARGRGAGGPNSCLFGGRGLFAAAERELA